MADLSLPDVTVVTGAAGWLGVSLLHRLRVDRTIVALVLDEREGAVVRALVPEATVVVGSVADESTIGRLFAALPSGAIDVVHTAGVIHPRSTAEFTAVNATGTMMVAAAARQAGVRRFVHVSSNSPFGVNATDDDTFRTHEPYNPYLGYGESKMHGELAVLDEVERGLDAVIVRPPWFYGPFQPPRQTTFFRMVRTGRFPVFGDGQQRRSMCYVENLVHGIERAELTKEATGKGYWIADARPYTVREIVETVGRALRDEGYEVKDGSMRLPVLAGRIAERADRFLQGTGRYQQQLHVLGEMTHTIACDISAAEHELGYQPAVALYEGMRRSIEWCRGEGLEL